MRLRSARKRLDDGAVLRTKKKSNTAGLWYPRTSAERLPASVGHQLPAVPRQTSVG